MKIIDTRYVLRNKDVELLHVYKKVDSSPFCVLQHKRYCFGLSLHNRVIVYDYSIIGMLMKMDIMNVDLSCPIIMYEHDRRHLEDGDIELIDEFCKRHNTEFYVVRLV